MLRHKQTMIIRACSERFQVLEKKFQLGHSKQASSIVEKNFSSIAHLHGRFPHLLLSKTKI